MVDSGMAERLVNVDRDTPMLLPVDLREWVPEDDLVHFVINAVETMNLSAVSVNSRGSGSKQYPPQYNPHQSDTIYSLSGNSSASWLGMRRATDLCRAFLRASCLVGVSRWYIFNLVAWRPTFR
jgi:hypothetical protein